MKIRLLQVGHCDAFSSRSESMNLEIPKCGPEGLDAYLQSKAVIAMVS